MMSIFGGPSANGRLKTTDRLLRFGLIDDNSCPLCDNDNDTANHLLVIANLPLRFGGLQESLAPLTGRKIWKARNDTVFKDIIITTSTVVATATSYQKEVLLIDDVVEEGINQTTPTTIWWSPPLNSHININFDGSIQGNSAAGGYVFSNHEDKVNLSRAKRLGKTTIPTAEAVTLRDSLVKANEQDYQNIQVECDLKLSWFPCSDLAVAQLIQLVLWIL
ncbi:hypothetical protein ACLB2K_013799 [Fragaria x ananassa]